MIDKLRNALNSARFGFWEEDNRGGSAPERQFGIWVETDDLPDPEELVVWLAKRDQEVRAQALLDAAEAVSFPVEQVGCPSCHLNAEAATEVWLRQRAETERAKTT